MALMTSHIQLENTNFAFAYRLFVGRYRTAIKSGRDKSRGVLQYLDKKRQVRQIKYIEQ